MFASTALPWEQPKTPLSVAEASRHLFSSHHKTSVKDRPEPYGAGSFCLATQLSILRLVIVWSQDICSTLSITLSFWQEKQEYEGQKMHVGMPHESDPQEEPTGRSYPGLQLTSHGLGTHRVATSPFKRG